MGANPVKQTKIHVRWNNLIVKLEKYVGQYIFRKLIFSNLT